MVVKSGLHGDSVGKREFLTFANLPTYFAKKGNKLGNTFFSIGNTFSNVPNCMSDLNQKL